MNKLSPFNKKVITAAEEICRLYAAKVGSRVCQDWEGAPEAISQFTDDEQQRLIEIDGDLEENHLHDGMVFSYTISAALKHLLEESEPEDASAYKGAAVVVAFTDNIDNKRSTYISFGAFDEDDENCEVDSFGVPDNKIFYYCSYKEFMDAVNTDGLLDEFRIFSYDLKKINSET